MQIAINGIARSGSTLVGQIVKGVTEAMLPGTKVIRTHPACCDYEADYTFITIRHPFDVAESRYAVRLSRDPAADGIHGMEAELDVMLQQYEFLFYLFDTPHTLLRYELFYLDYSVIFEAIRQTLNIDIPAELEQHLSTKYSLAANRTRANQLANFLEHDEEGIHGDHIGAVEPGAWHKLSEEMRHLVIERCSTAAGRLNYE